MEDVSCLPGGDHDTGATFSQFGDLEDLSMSMTEAVPGALPETEPFWKLKSLEEMTHAEWESLCDGCGQCCLIKLEDEDTGGIFVTRLACTLLEIGSCQCSDYGNRHAHVADCIVITPKNVRELPWLPETCAYRRLAEGRDLSWWHPLVSGEPETVHLAGVSVRAWARTEKGVKEKAIGRYIIGYAD